MKRKVSNLKKAQVKETTNVDRAKASFLNNGHDFPLVLSATYSDMSITKWMRNNKSYVDSHMNKHGAILFRGFRVNSIEKFQHFMTYFGDEVLEYKLRSSPRHAVGEKVYVSTSYPAEYAIEMHSESSYSPFHPKIIAFCCLEAADEGGETPIADNRKVFDHISDKSKEKFQKHGITYRRYFPGDYGMTWHEAFQTENKSEVEEECQRMDIDFEWQNGNELVLTWTKKAIWNHPETSELVWFNHALFFNKFAPGNTAIAKVVEVDELPNNTFFGDRTEILKEEIDEILNAYRKSTIEFKWQEGDVLLLDNMLISHGRNSFKGSRNIIVSMS